MRPQLLIFHHYDPVGARASLALLSVDTSVCGVLHPVDVLRSSDLLSAPPLPPLPSFPPFPPFRPLPNAWSAQRQTATWSSRSEHLVIYDSPASNHTTTTGWPGESSTAWTHFRAKAATDKEGNVTNAWPDILPFITRTDMPLFVRYMGHRCENVMPRLARTHSTPTCWLQQPRETHTQTAEATAAQKHVCGASS